MSIGRFLGEFFTNFLAFIMMIIMSIVSFFFTVFVVDFGATLAGYPKDQYTVLSAALLVSASIIAGGISPLGFMSQPHQSNETTEATGS